jgi:hypothetical protein
MLGAKTTQAKASSPPHNLVTSRIRPLDLPLALVQALTVTRQRRIGQVRRSPRSGVMPKK